MKLRDKIRIDTQSLSRLPTLSQSAERIIALTNKELTHLEELREIIENDPPIMSKVLGVANMLYLGYASPVTNVMDAILKLGFKTLKNIAVGISIFSLFKADKTKERSYKKLFRHSIATGYICEIVGKRYLEIDEEAYIVAGTLHDLGFFALHYLHFEAFSQIEKLVLKGNSIKEAESKVIDVDHNTIGKWLSDWWKLPDYIGDVIYYHHSDPLSIDSKYRNIIALTHLSDYIAISLGFSIFNGEESELFQSSLYKLFSLPPLNEIIYQIEEEFPFEELNAL